MGTVVNQRYILQTFTDNASWTAPFEIPTLEFVVIGAGGNSTGANGTANIGGAGAGAVIHGTYNKFPKDTTLAITVGKESVTQSNRATIVKGFPLAKQIVATGGNDNLGGKGGASGSNGVDNAMYNGSPHLETIPGVSVNGTAKIAYAGGSAFLNLGGGGGGASGRGGDGNFPVGDCGSRGNGISLSITGTAVTYGVGGVCAKSITTIKAESYGSGGCSTTRPPQPGVVYLRYLHPDYATARNENLPIELYSNTYVEARKYIRNTDISTLSTVRKAFSFINFATPSPSLVDAYAGPTVTPTSPLPIEAPSGDTLYSVRNELRLSMIDIVNTLNAKYPWPAGQSAPTPLSNTTLVSDVISARVTILGLWSVLLSQRIQDISGMIGNPDISGSTGTYQSSRNNTDSGCVSPYSGTGVGGCWSDVGIQEKKGEVQNRLALNESEGILNYSYGGLGKLYGIPAHANITFNDSIQLIFNADKISFVKFNLTLGDRSATNLLNIINASGKRINTSNKLTLTLPDKLYISHISFNAITSRSGKCDCRVNYGPSSDTINTIVSSYTITSGQNTIKIPQFADFDIYYSLTFFVPNTNPLTTLNVNSLFFYSFLNTSTPLSEYEIVNNVYTTFFNSQLTLQQSISDKVLVKDSMTRFYKDTYIPYMRYLKAIDVNSSSEIQIALSKTLAYYYDSNGSMKATFEPLLPSDSYSSLLATVDNGYIAFANLLVNTYTSTFALWTSAPRNMTTTAASPPATPLTISTTSDASDAIFAYTTTSRPQKYWPQLITDITNFTKQRIQATQVLRTLYASMPSAPPLPL